MCSDILEVNEFETIIREGKVPPRFRGPLSYKLAHRILLLASQHPPSDLSEYDTLKLVYGAIDNAIVMPTSGNFSNFKKKISSKKSQKSGEICQPLYPQLQNCSSECDAGVRMLEIGLTDDLYSKIVLDTISNEELKKIEKVDHIDNRLALEIMFHAQETCRVSDFMK